MNNFLESQKQPVRDWSKIGALTWTLGLPSLRLGKGATLVSQKDGEAVNSGAKALFMGWLVGIGVITDYVSYYALSSVFWPESLSLFNGVLLAPCGVMSFWNGREVVRMVLERK